MAWVLGQATATWRTLVIGGQALGAATSGLLATAVGIRPTLLLATAGMLAGVLIALCSPLRTLHALPSEEQSRRSMSQH
jgi:Transmembrane secretion effector